MGKSVREIENEFTHTELIEWMIYYKIEPFGEIRADMRTASICQMLANINRGKNRKPYPLKNFMLFRDIPNGLPKKQSTEEMKEILLSLVPKEQREKHLNEHSNS